MPSPKHVRKRAGATADTAPSSSPSPRTSAESPHATSERAAPSPRRGRGRRPDGSAHALETVSAPKQARSERTLEQILAAAERLIIERGLRAVSVADIVAAAGTSVGGFYGRFRDKEELLLALHERAQRELRAEVVALLDPARWETATLADIVRVCVPVLVRRALDRRRLNAAFLESVAAHPEGWQRAVEFRAQMVDGVMALLLSRRAEITHPSPRIAVRFAVEAALAIVDERALFHAVEASGSLEDEALAAEIERLVLSYLTAR
ncbi:MAG: TetR/AcrR family transcriptional regulator [Myxococcales bacterium]|nr:TetR/AcrR family transcriptional regulator [Myxococcales bacterium]